MQAKKRILLRDFETLKLADTRRWSLEQIGIENPSGISRPKSASDRPAIPQYATAGRDRGAPLKAIEATERRPAQADHHPRGNRRSR